MRVNNHLAALYGEKQQELTNCFKECYGVDDKISQLLLEKFTPLFQSPDDSQIIDNFIGESKKLNIDFANPPPQTTLTDDDAILASPDQHEVVFESAFVRILWSNTQPKEKEPLHRHPWKRIVVAIQNARFKVTDGLTGKVEIMDYKKGIHHGEPNEFYSCENIGVGNEESLGFEIKS